MSDGPIDLHTHSSVSDGTETPTQLVRAAVIDVPSALLAVASLVLLVRWKLNTTWLILGGALAGWTVHALR